MYLISVSYALCGLVRIWKMTPATNSVELYINCPGVQVSSPQTLG